MGSLAASSSAFLQLGSGHDGAKFQIFRPKGRGGKLGTNPPLGWFAFLAVALQWNRTEAHPSFLLGTASRKGFTPLNSRYFMAPLFNVLNTEIIHSKGNTAAFPNEALPLFLAERAVVNREWSQIHILGMEEVSMEEFQSAL